MRSKQHANDASDELMVNTWLENPYWQFFTGKPTVKPDCPLTRRA